MADPRRLLAPTVCSEAGAAPRPAAIFQPLHGYSTADVLQDRRFRARPKLLACMLCSATLLFALHQSSRGRGPLLSLRWHADRESCCVPRQRLMIMMCWHMQSSCACLLSLLAGAADAPVLLGDALPGLLQVLEALQKLDMHRSPYARRLVQSAAPATAPRSDALCTA